MFKYELSKEVGWDFLDLDKAAKENGGTEHTVSYLTDYNIITRKG